MDYLRAKEVENPHRRIVALIPEVQPEHWWLWFLHNQRGAVLNRAIMNGTDNVVICRLRFRLAHLAPDEDPADAPAAGGPAEHRGDRIRAGPRAGLCRVSRGPGRG